MTGKAEQLLFKESAAMAESCAEGSFKAPAPSSRGANNAAVRPR